MRIAVAAAGFGRDLGLGVERALGLVDDAAAAGADLLVLPHGVLGGYVDDLERGALVGAGMPPALALDDAHVGEVVGASDRLVVCFGFTEAVRGGRSNTVVCAWRGDVLGVHRKAHLPPGEVPWYQPGDALAPVDTPLGPIGLLIDYDKTFPEAARSLALQGAELLACACAWPMSVTRPASRMASDRQSALFDLYDRARAAENQVVLATANLTGSQGRLRFLGQAKVVLPDGSVAARTGFRAGLAVADVDVPAVVAAARSRQHHLAERRPELYR